MLNDPQWVSSYISKQEANRNPTTSKTQHSQRKRKQVQIEQILEDNLNFRSIFKLRIWMQYVLWHYTLPSTKILRLFPAFTKKEWHIGLMYFRLRTEEKVEKLIQPHTICFANLEIQYIICQHLKSDLRKK